MLNDIWTLLKADRHSLNILNQDFTNKAKTRFAKIGTSGLVILFVILICFVIGIYANLMASELAKQGATFVMLALMIIFSLIITITNTVYKSQGMLFTSKDNDLLLSLPIAKKTILATRLIKLMLSQYIWVCLILLPAIAVYAYYEGLTLSLILSSLVMLIAMPIMPVIVGTIVGYVITLIASRFKNKNLIQIIISILTFIIVFAFSYKITDFIESIADMDTEIYVFLKRLYYPLGLYIECLEKIDLLKLVEILVINLIPLLIFVVIFSYYYYNIISKLSENHAKSKFVLNKVKVNSPLKTLLVKESKKYFRSSIYLLNTIIGPMIMLAASIYLAYKGINLDSLRGIEGVTEDLIIQVEAYLPVFVYVIVFFCVGLSNISASSISIEGSNIWHLKVLPLKVEKIFLAKAFFHVKVLMIPTCISLTLLCITLRMPILSSIILFITVILSVIVLALIGLVINILFPKLNASDITVVKQSASSFTSMLVTILLGAIVMYYIYKMPFSEPVILLGVISCICIVLIFVLWTYISRKGVEKFESLCQ